MHNWPPLRALESTLTLLCATRRLPILCLVDSDPHGLEILSTYKYGSAALDFDHANLAVRSVEWIGIKGTEWDAMGVPRDQLLPLTKADRSKALKLLKRTGIPEGWR